uniref:Uncharacterized protein n=1 Tax=Parascaris equorum TaxID=6256 RepID=A0A914RWJ8_PAREQ
MRRLTKSETRRILPVQEIERGGAKRALTAPLSFGILS